MGKYTTQDIRNVCLIGHSADGKTSLAEAMLYITKGTDRLGTPTDGNTVCDYDPEEIKRGFSLSDAIAPVEYKGKKLNFIDTPGYLDFIGEVVQGMRVADSALIVVDGKAGVEVGTELAWNNVRDAKLPRAFFINKIDDSEAHFDKVFTALREKFGPSVCPLIIPVGQGAGCKGLLDLIDMKEIAFGQNGASSTVELPADAKAVAEEYSNMLYESIAETDEALMEKFFGGEEITRDEAVKAIHEGFVNGDIAPVICGSATKLWGITTLMDTVIDTFPDPSKHKEQVVNEDGSVADFDGKGTSVFVFKTIADQYGKMSFFKVMSGEVRTDDTFKNLETGVAEKFSHIYMIRGKTQTEVDSLATGDIGITSKLTNTNTNDTLTTEAAGKPFVKIVFPESFMQMGVEPLAKGDEDKISQGITKLLGEDKTIKYENNAETKQMTISGQGDIHLDVIVSKLKNRFGTSVKLTDPKIAYRESIKKKIQAEGKHKKQSGGHGQYGHVKITFSPSDEPGLHFSESVFGGSVPKNFFPAVEKGLAESMKAGVLAGYPMDGLNADLYDGSYHPVDSSEMAFKVAANLAYKELVKADPVLLEPVGKLCVYVPDSYMGDVIGLLNKRRGRVLGMTPTGKKGEQVVEAEAPFSEMTDFTIALRAMTQGRGRFTFYFERYEEVPREVAQKVVEAAKKEQEA